MPKRTNDGAIKLTFPTGKRGDCLNAAWFIFQTGKQNSKENIVENRDAVEEKWKAFVSARFSENEAEVKVAELRTPRVRRLWADLYLQNFTYVSHSRVHRLPFRAVVSWPPAKRDKIAVLYGLFGEVIWVPFYGDGLAGDLVYSFFAAALISLNPAKTVTPQMADSIYTHLLRNEFWEDPVVEVEDQIKGDLAWGQYMYWPSQSQAKFPLVYDRPLRPVMIIPSQASRYQEFNTACHFLNPRSRPSREQVWDAFRWLHKPDTGLTGDALDEAKESLLPASFDLDRYHEATKIFGTEIRSYLRGKQGPHTLFPDKFAYRMAYQCHRLLEITPDEVLPLVRVPLPLPESESKHKNQVLANFSYIYQLINPSPMKTKADINKAWKTITDAPSEISHHSEAANENADTHQWKSDKMPQASKDTVSKAINTASEPKQTLSESTQDASMSIQTASRPKEAAPEIAQTASDPMQTASKSQQTTSIPECAASDSKQMSSMAKPKQTAAGSKKTTIKTEESSNYRIDTSKITTLGGCRRDKIKKQTAANALAHQRDESPDEELGVQGWFD